MHIQVNTDRNIEGSSDLSRGVEAVVRSTLDRFTDRITRVEIHLSDQNSQKKSGTDDMRCLIEARLAGRQPISVSHQAETVEKAVDGAVKQLRRSIDSTLGRLGGR